MVVRPATPNLFFLKAAVISPTGSRGTSIPLNFSTHSTSLSNYRPPHFSLTRRCVPRRGWLCQQETKITDSGRHLISKRVLTQFLGLFKKKEEEKKRKEMDKGKLPMCNLLYHNAFSSSSCALQFGLDI